MPRAARGRLLSLDDLECRSPAWTPDGRAVVFTGKMDGVSKIYSVGLDGMDPKPLTDGPRDYDPAPSPGGDRLAFTRQDGDHIVLHIANADGSDLVGVAGGPSRNEEAAWAPDGRRIAVLTDRDFGEDIWILERDGDHSMTKITDSTSHDMNPAWSPSGDQIAFASDRDGPFGIYVMDADGANVRRAAPGHGRSPAWSPDGKTIAFEGTEEPQSSRGPLPVAICLLDMASGDVDWVGEATLGHEPSWSPDGKLIAHTHGLMLRVLEVATRTVHLLAKGVPA